MNFGDFMCPYSCLVGRPTKLVPPHLVIPFHWVPPYLVDSRHATEFKREKYLLISKKHFICICLQFHILIHSIPFRNKSWKTKIHGMICTSYNQWKQNVATRPSKYGLNFVKSRDLNFFKTKFQGKVS